MVIEDRIKAFDKLGNFLIDFCDENSNSNHPLENIIKSSISYNGWFTSNNIRCSISAICNNLSSIKLSSWISSYSIPVKVKKNVSIIMAGNIPLVGFNDFLCVLMSGHRSIIKLSSKDNRLFSPIIKELIKIEPRFEDDIKIVEKVENFDAVIATGSNESFKHFDYYFKDYPTLLRKSRTSVAILTGEESLEERRHYCAQCLHMNSINTVFRNKFTFINNLKISRRKTKCSTNFLSLNNLSLKRIIVA